MLINTRCLSLMVLFLNKFLFDLIRTFSLIFCHQYTSSINNANDKGLWETSEKRLNIFKIFQQFRANQSINCEFFTPGDALEVCLVTKWRFRVKAVALESKICGTRVLTDTGENVQKWTRVFSTRRWVILVAQTRRKTEEEYSRPLLDVFACGQVSSPRLYRLKRHVVKYGSRKPRVVQKPRSEKRSENGKLKINGLHRDHSPARPF